jgi:transposase
MKIQPKWCNYTEEFKRDAVRLVTEQGYGVSETARKLGINAHMLGRWKRECDTKASAAFPGNGRMASDKEEVQRVRDENKRLRRERDMLKNRFVAPARHLWGEQLPPVGSRCSDGRSDRRLIGGSAPVKKPGPGTLADVRVVTPWGAPVEERDGAAVPPPVASRDAGGHYGTSQPIARPPTASGFPRRSASRCGERHGGDMACGGGTAGPLPGTGEHRAKVYWRSPHQLAAGCVDLGLPTVAMESTGSDWMPVVARRAARAVAVLVVHVRPVKHGPGRKTAGNAAQWLQPLPQDG